MSNGVGVLCHNTRHVSSFLASTPPHKPAGEGFAGSRHSCPPEKPRARGLHMKAVGARFTGPWVVTAADRETCAAQDSPLRVPESTDRRHRVGAPRVGPRRLSELVKRLGDKKCSFCVSREPTATGGGGHFP
jgi:hypothetical protein